FTAVSVWPVHLTGPSLFQSKSIPTESKPNIAMGCLPSLSRGLIATSREPFRSAEDQNRRSLKMAQELEVSKKRQVKSEEESTVPVSMFIPTTDIYETEAALMVVVEMPAVGKGNVDIAVKDGVLTIDGRIDFQKYAGM